MQSCDIICMGKISQKYVSDGCDEFVKRLRAFCNLRIVELAPVLPAGKNPSPTEIDKALAQEGERILAAIRPGSEVVALCVEGKSFTSPALAKLFEENANYGGGHITFIIGSSHGLHESVKKAAAHRMSFSALTFPHQLFRLLLLEQVYRAYTIISGTPYHK